MKKKKQVAVVDFGLYDNSIFDFDYNINFLKLKKISEKNFSGDQMRNVIFWLNFHFFPRKNVEISTLTLSIQFFCKSQNLIDF